MYSPNYFQASYSSAYAQAYFGAASSSTFTSSLPGIQNVTNPQNTINPPPPQQGQWYAPGTARCNYPKCAFAGSAKSLEIHRMDRHLIYPPNYHKNKQRDEWDADPSLKGKKLPIMGTTISLDTPEALEAWIAERKKRWPSKDRVVEKRKRLEEAVERGQLDATVLENGRNKRRRIEGGSSEVRGRGRGRGLRGGRGNRGARGGRGGASRGDLPPKPVDQRVPAVNSGDSSNDEDEDGPPEIASSKQPLATSPPLPVPVPVPAPKPVLTKLRAPKQPRPPPANPFARHDNSLMRNLLLPEIRITVSNLSQAIRFLVDNEFLDDVELHPGDADKPMIEVVNTVLKR